MSEEEIMRITEDYGPAEALRRLMPVAKESQQVVADLSMLLRIAMTKLPLTDKNQPFRSRVGEYMHRKGLVGAVIRTEIEKGKP